MNSLYYGDNLEVLRKYIKDETVDLCYIDPPFNSKRNYNQIYNNVGTEDRAQAQAFVDTWTWDDHASEGFSQIPSNDGARFTPQTVDLLKGLHPVLKKGSLLAYLVSMTLRIVEIHRVLKPTGSLYLHCDPTASHYLKLVLDTIFVTQGGDFLNEIIWSYRRWPSVSRQFQTMHDVIFFYSKDKDAKRTFNIAYEENSDSYTKRFKGKTQMLDPETKTRKITLETESKGLPQRAVWDISIIAGFSKERLGYPTQKPETLLSRILQASTNEGDTVLDAYCGCGTTIAVAQRLGRTWIGMDITYQSISVILRRLEAQFGKTALESVTLNGIPRDMASAVALANKKDDRVRKEFEKWAILTYSNNRAIINQKKGADAGVDGVAYFQTGYEDNAKIIFQVKSGGVGRGDIAKLHSDMLREGAALAVFLTLEPPTGPMKAEAKGVGTYYHDLMGRNYDKIQIVTVQEIVEAGERLEIPMSLEVLKKAQAVTPQEEHPQLFSAEP